MRNIIILLLLVVSTTSFSQGARSLTFKNDTAYTIEVLSLETNYYFMNSILLPYYSYYNGIAIPPGKQVIFMQTNDATAFPFCCFYGCDYLTNKTWQYDGGFFKECYEVSQPNGGEFLHYVFSKLQYKTEVSTYAGEIRLGANRGNISNTFSMDSMTPGPVTILHQVIDSPGLVYNQVITFR